MFDPLSDEQNAELNQLLTRLAAIRHANPIRRRSLCLRCHGETGRTCCPWCPITDPAKVNDPGPRPTRSVLQSLMTVAEREWHIAFDLAGRDAPTADNETSPATTQTAGKDPSNKAEEGKQ